ncbi:MFS transporter [Lysinibacillus fusiformis]|uniref:MFS transporter, CP family, cyanate transporter n=1 Tax=Lysinibacillus fusiformis TaxID=28031 RepID=A0A1H9MSW0_9BACI|nr:MFS transporter [Lysinibacillus fusiformis]SCX41490.1 MFS transporter, CP family, cyanate transporter [Lysinibacillus fusiformis]SCY60407.1 MFS transporter, CP family, cyanate transporter [Lysinibacillus fusiformis]SDB10695.1 MFS transporter, CP family, cyanate transporter [Lysinibacillus fusiformis]SEN99718.1 MFS transporter, CP family, cyanate transporter [Lysinibacillus fusiformis]SER26223.1 MFS transporter, CP family, cyanate transporter [Lysinibacillus fusiformis]
MGKKQWTVSLILVVISIFFVALNMRPAVTGIGPLYNVLMTNLQVSNTSMSFLTSIPVFCMGLFAPIAVPFQRKLGTKLAIVLLMVILIFANGLRFFQESYLLLVVTSFAAGLAIAMIGPILNAFIKKKFPQRFTIVIGIYSFGIGVGATLSAALTVSFYQYFDNQWTVALGMWALLAMVALILWSWAIPKEQGADGEELAKNEPARNPWVTGRAWSILLYFGLQTSLFFSMMSWLTPLLQDKGMTLKDASMMLTFMSIVQMIGNIAVPMLMEKWTNRLAWAVALGCLGLIGFTLLWLLSGIYLWLAVLIIGIVLSGLFPIGLLLPLDEARNDQEANSWSSMVFSGGFMLSAIIPVLIGVCYDMTGNHTWTYVIFLALMLGIIATTGLLRKN